MNDHTGHTITLGMWMVIKVLVLKNWEYYDPILLELDIIFNHPCNIFCDTTVKWTNIMVEIFIVLMVISEVSVNLGDVATSGRTERILVSGTFNVHVDITDLLIWMK